jgi:hypothetical protein
MQAKSLYHESTIQNADSIESHPSLAGLFALGTYQVDQEKDESASAGASSDYQEVEGTLSSSSSPEYSRRGTLRLKQVGRDSTDSITWYVYIAVVRAPRCSNSLLLLCQ